MRYPSSRQLSKCFKSLKSSKSSKLITVHVVLKVIEVLVDHKLSLVIADDDVYEQSTAGEVSKCVKCVKCLS
jgi:hypothetical protein